MQCLEIAATAASSQSSGISRVQQIFAAKPVGGFARTHLDNKNRLSQWLELAEKLLIAKKTQMSWAPLGI